MFARLHVWYHKLALKNAQEEIDRYTRHYDWMVGHQEDMHSAAEELARMLRDTPEDYTAIDKQQRWVNKLAKQVPPHAAGGMTYAKSMIAHHERSRNKHRKALEALGA